MTSSTPVAREVSLDPPIPKAANSLVKMTRGEQIRVSVIAFSVGAGLGWWAYYLFQWHHQFWGAVIALAALVSLLTAFSPKTPYAVCPFCTKKIGHTLGTEGEELQCPHCWEYSTYTQGKIRPLDPDSISLKPKFESPVFHDAVWPAGCLACGEAATRVESLSATSLNALGLALGRVLVARGKLENVAYCDKHREALDLVMKQDKTMRLKWSSLRMMRRYLAANRGKRH